MKLEELINLSKVSINIDDKLVLDRVDFSLYKGEFTYIVGDSGSGKSSFLKMLYGELKMSSGQAIILGNDMGQLENKHIPLFRRDLGIVFQEYSLFESWSVFENLNFVLRATDWSDENKIKARIEEVLDVVGLAQYMIHKVHQLSGGQKQQLTIARAILNQPKIIIADEPTAGLDPRSADNVLYILHEIAKTNGTAVVMATHDYRLISKFPARIYECKLNSLIEKN